MSLHTEVINYFIYFSNEKGSNYIILFVPAAIINAHNYSVVSHLRSTICPTNLIVQINNYNGAPVAHDFDP